MATLAVFHSFRWPRFPLAETDASDGASAACYRSSKHVGIAAVVVSELKLRDIQRRTIGAALAQKEPGQNSGFGAKPMWTGR